MWVAGLAFTVIATVAVGWWLQHGRCERRCAAAVEQAGDAAARGELARALAIIDEADHACDCARFTDGDEPPEYAAARTYLDRLRSTGRDAEARAALDGARGAILRDLARSYDRAP
jgi:hypothetical protein